MFSSKRPREHDFSDAFKGLVSSLDRRDANIVVNLVLSAKCPTAAEEEILSMPYVNFVTHISKFRTTWMTAEPNVTFCNF